MCFSGVEEGRQAFVMDRGDLLLTRRADRSLLLARFTLDLSCVP